MEFIAGVLVGVAAWPAFWLVFAILSVILSAFVVNERGGWSTLVTIGLGVMIAAKWQAIVANPLPLILGVIGYVIVGILWSRFKWSRFLSGQFDKFAEARDSFIKKTPSMTRDKLNSLTGDALDGYKNHLKNYFGHMVRFDEYAENLTKLNQSLAPKAVHNKGSIVLWIIYWPVTAVWYIFADIVTDIAKGLYNMVGGHFQKMSNEKFNSL